MKKEITCTRKTASDYSRARAGLLVMFALTVINMTLIILNADISFPFSASVPQILLIFGYEFAFSGGAEAYLWICVFAAAIALALSYFICWLFSVSPNYSMLAALILFSVDTLGLALLAVLAFSASSLIDFVFHGWLLYYLAVGTRAAASLRKLSPAELAALNQPILNPGVKAANGTSNADTPPVRCDRPRGRTVISARYGGTDISVKRRFGLTELIIGGKVYAEYRILNEMFYSMRATLGGTEYRTDYVAHGLHGTRSLYADGKQIGEKAANNI